MTEQEYQESTRKQYLDLKEMLKLVLNNQVIGDRKLDSLQEEVNTVLHRENMLLHEQDKLLKEVERLQRQLNR